MNYFELKLPQRFQSASEEDGNHKNVDETERYYNCKPDLYPFNYLSIYGEVLQFCLKTPEYRHSAWCPLP